MTETASYSIQYQAAPQWVVGWNTDDPSAVIPLDADDHYPDDYAGRCVAVCDVDKEWGGEASAACMRLITLELSDAERIDLINHNKKILNGAVVDVTALDRFGSRLVNAYEDEFGAEWLALKAEGERVPQIVDEENEIALEAEKVAADYASEILYRFESVEARVALPQTVTHTGTGLYAVKKSVTSSADTIVSVVGQVVTLTTGGLGTSDAFKGGYATVGSVTRSIVSHTDNTITFEGDISAWSGAITTYDAWSTIAGAEAQLWIDQGATTFTSTQQIDVEAGTWYETITANLSLTATPRYSMTYTGDNRNTIIDANGTLTYHVAAGNTYNNQFSGFTFTGACTSDYMVHSVSGTSYYNLFDNCLFDGSAGVSNRVTYGCHCWFRGCEIDGSNGLTNIEVLGGHLHEFTRCKLHDLASVAFYPTADFSLDSCELYNISYAVLRSATLSTSYGRHIIRNNVFYNIVRFSGLYASHRNLEMTNNIFHTVTDEMFYEPLGYLFDLGGEGVNIDNNTYYNINEYLYSANETSIATFSAWQARNAALGNEQNSNERDPLFTDAAAYDFSLKSTSPERHARPSSGVATDINGDARNRYRVSTGAHDYGNPAATWSAGSGLALADLGDGGTLRATWDAITDEVPTTLDYEYVIADADTLDIEAIVPEGVLTYDLASNPIGVPKNIVIGTRYKQVTDNVTLDSAIATATPSNIVIIPDTPAISGIVDDGTGVSFTIGCITASALDRVFAYYRDAGTPGSEWELFNVSRLGTGDLQVTGLLENTKYEVQIVATRGSSATENPSEPSAPAFVLVTSGDYAPAIDIIKSLLVADADVTAIVGSGKEARIYVETGLQGGLTPYVVLYLQDDVPLQGVEEVMGINEVTIDLYIVAKRTGDLDALSKAISLALNGFIGDVAGTTGTSLVSEITLERFGATVNQPSVGAEVGLKQRNAECQMFYQQQAPDAPA